MSNKIEARLAKIEEQLKELDGKLNQDQWLHEFTGGLEAYVLKTEPTPAQEKVFNDWAVSQSKSKAFKIKGE